MPKEHISDEMLDAFVDRQLSSEDRLRILRTIAADHSLSKDVCDRQQIKELVGLAYRDPAPGPPPALGCGIRPWPWWRRA